MTLDKNSCVFSIRGTLRSDFETLLAKEYWILLDYLSLVVQFSPRTLIYNCRKQSWDARILFESEISVLYLHLKHCNRVIQHLYTNCQHFSSFSWCCGRCPTTSVHTSWRRMTVRHFRADTLHTKTFYIIHLESFILSYGVIVWCVYFLKRDNQYVYIMSSSVMRELWEIRYHA